MLWNDVTLNTTIQNNNNYQLILGEKVLFHENNTATKGNGNGKTKGNRNGKTKGNKNGKTEQFVWDFVDRNAENVLLILIGHLSSAQQNLFANYMPNWIEHRMVNGHTHILCDIIWNVRKYST